MKRIIKGYEKFVSKKNKTCYAIFCKSEFQVRDGVEQVGERYETVMCFDETPVFNDKCIGHELVGYFGYSNGTTVVQTPSVL